MTDSPRADELPALIDEGLRLVTARLTSHPDFGLFKSVHAQLTYVRQVVRGERPSDAVYDDALLLGRYAAYEFETSDPTFADVLFKVQYLYDRRQATTGNRPPLPG